MNKQNISPKDIDALAKKLDELGKSLDEKERALLLATFGMASTVVSNASRKAESESGTLPAAKSPTVDRIDLSRTATAKLPPLSQAFKEAFTPGPAGRFGVDDGATLQDSVSVGVGVGPVDVSWSKDI
ncbi:MAG TPA: hypothetical protein VF794_22085 [Archangium sp.]|jgi:hypothetical protein|uniref:hypothetical protein n=1 Tax=Archangium sp. TaxID=1872627 RepID=UPI002ED9431A